MRILVRFSLLFLLLLGSGQSAVAAIERPYIVTIQTSIAETGDYYLSLLRMILEASKAPDERIEFRFSEKSLAQARWIAALLQDTGNSVLWTMTSEMREQTMRPIRVPLMKGLMGYRLLVIRKEDEAKFAKVNTKEDLLAFRVGQGTHWPDTDILRANRFHLMEAMAVDNLYKMLIAKRFDFFPRGVTEAYREGALIQPQNLMIEPHLLLHYRTDLYFFVNKKNIELAKRLEKGWAIILKNGEYEKFFMGQERVKVALEILKSRNYKIIELDNPFLSPESSELNAAYWLEPDKSPVVPHE